MEEKKKEGQELSINCVLCDATGVKEEVLKSYSVIVVNGSVTCPESLSGMLSQLQINGQSTFYPDGAGLLKDVFSGRKKMVNAASYQL